jgi:hypothetical protein
MADLERALEQLAPGVEWPATPTFELRRRARRRRWLVAVAVVLLALAIAFAVPPARSALLRFFHLGGVTIERVDTLPPAQERSLGSSLGVPITASAARELLGARFRVPGDLEPQLYRSGQVVSTLLATPDPVLLSEFRAGARGDLMIKKLIGYATDAQGVDLGLNVPAVWIHGREHAYLAPPLPPRLAGNTLLWVEGFVTYRLEGKTLTLARARELAREIAAG